MQWSLEKKTYRKNGEIGLQYQFRRGATWLTLCRNNWRACLYCQQQIKSWQAVSCERINDAVVSQLRQEELETVPIRYSRCKQISEKLQQLLFRNLVNFDKAFDSNNRCQCGIHFVAGKTSVVRIFGSSKQRLRLQRKTDWNIWNIYLSKYLSI